MTADIVGDVGTLLLSVADEIVLPLFGTTGANAREKKPGDWVTDADLRSEAALAEGLAAILPGSLVVGEEAVHADPGVLGRLETAERVWLIDPVDGTANYAAGREPFAMLVALVERGLVTHGWIYLPVEGRMFTAQRGSGVQFNGAPLPVRNPAHTLRGIVPLPALTTDAAADVERRSSGSAELLPSCWCSGREYPDVLVGRADFVLFTASMPWDHAAGSLAIAELGGRAAYLDGTPYTVLDHRRRALLVANTPSTWDRVRNHVLVGLA